MLDKMTNRLDFHGNALILRGERQRILASNIANADTPGYVGRDMHFTDALRAQCVGRLTGQGRQSVSQEGPNQRLHTTAPGHIPLQQYQRQAWATPYRRNPASGQEHRRSGPRTRCPSWTTPCGTRPRCASSMATPRPCSAPSRASERKHHPTRLTMSMFSIFNVSGSAVSAQSQRLNVVASNLANVDAVAGPDGKAYKARQVVFRRRPWAATTWRACA